MMHGETGRLLELRRELDKAMEMISDNHISIYYKDIETYIYKIVDLKGDYQSEVEDFLNMYSVVLEGPSVLDE